MRITTLLLVLAVAATTFAFSNMDRRKQDDTFGNGKMTQVALVVRDIEQAAESFADVLKMDVPDVIITDPLEKANTRYHGEATEARAKLAFFHLDNITIELIEPVGGPSIWQDWLDEHGEGVHHIAFQVPDMDESVAYLEMKGGSLAQRGDFTGGSYSYVDMNDRLHLLIELLASTGD